jgi:hypothetical protein
VLFAMTWTSFTAFGQYGLTFTLLDTLWNASFTLVYLVVLTRCGLLGLATMFFVTYVATEIPLTFDASLWWAPRCWAVLAVFVALGVYGFRSSLAGKPAFGGDWLET